MHDAYLGNKFKSLFKFSETENKYIQENWRNFNTN